MSTAIKTLIGVLSISLPPALLMFPRIRSLFLRNGELITHSLEESINASECISYAKKIQICAGELCSFYYNHNKIIEYLTSSIISNDAKIELVFGPALYVNDFKLLRLVHMYPNNFSLYKSKKRNSKHFKIIYDQNDTKTFFLDVPHKINESKRKGLRINNYTANLNDKIVHNFETIKQDAKKLHSNIKEVINEFRSRKVYTENNELCYEGFVKRIGDDLSLAEGNDIKTLEDYVLN